MEHQVLALYHPVIAHAAIILFTAALALDIIGFLGRQRAFSISDWLIFLGAALCFPALVTGAHAAATLDPNLPHLKFHAQIAYMVTVFGLLYALVRVAGYFQYIRIIPLLYVVLTLTLVYLSSWLSTFYLK